MCAVCPHVYMWYINGSYVNNGLLKWPMITFYFTWISCKLSWVCCIQTGTVTPATQYHTTQYHTAQYLPQGVSPKWSQHCSPPCDRYIMAMGDERSRPGLIGCIAKTLYKSVNPEFEPSCSSFFSALHFVQVVELHSTVYIWCQLTHMYLHIHG